MKIPERTGKWVEIDTATDADDEIAIQVPNTIWAGWLVPVFLKQEDLASALRSLGWAVSVPAAVQRTKQVAAGRQD